MKVIYKYISGTRDSQSDWTTGLTSDLINRHVKKSEIELQRVFTICGITIQIVKIMEKSKEGIIFSKS